MITDIYLENFKQYRGRHHIHFERGPNLIQGLNDSGKSTILHAIAFVFFNQTPTLGSRTAALITQGETRTRVRVDFVDVRSGEKYGVVRARSMRSGEFSMAMILPDGSLRETVSSRSGAQEKNLQQELYEHLRISKRLFFTVLYSEQKEFVNLSRGGSDVKADLDILFGLTATRTIQEGFRNIKREVESRLVGESEAQSGLERLLVDKGLLVGDVRGASEMMLGAMKRMVQFKEEKEALVDIEEDVKEAEELVSKIVDVENRLKAQEGIAESLRRSLREFVGEYGSVEALKKAVKGVEEELRKVREEEENLMDYQKDLDTQLQRLISQRGYYSKTVAERGDVKGMETCPKCGQRVDPQHLAEEIGKLSAKLLEAETAVKGKRDELDIVVKSLESLKNAEKGLIQRRTLSVSGLSNLEKANGRVREAEAEIQKLKATLDEGVKALEEIRKPLSSRLATTLPEEVRSVMEGRVENVEQIQTVLREVRLVIGKRVSSLESGMENALNTIREKQEFMESKLNVLREKLRQIEEQRQKISKFETMRRNVSTLEKLEEAYQTMAVQLRDHLFKNVSARTYFWYTQLVRDKKYTSLSFDPESYMLLAKPIGFPEPVPVKDYTGGGHETIFAIAERLALSQVAEYQGLMLFDEPTDATDTQNRDQIIEALTRASQTFGQIVLITHHGLGREYTANTISVEYDGMGRSSRIVQG